MPLTFEAVKNSEAVNTYIRRADETLLALGYTEHSVAHVTKCAVTAARILRETGHSEDIQQLAAVAAYMHDIGNVINRTGHAQSGALMAFDLLRGVGATPDEIGTVVAAIGHHDEGTAFPVNDVTAALILADKTDVRRTRVRNRDTITFDIHDRVNYAVQKADLQINVPAGEIALHLTIDTQICSISEYFEIFLSRMILCRRAAERLKLKFGLVINGQGMM
ncbi:MAG: HD domain-containing protein [Clostridiales bacterium]|jgi:metal-dependent HD superfamily phosphatase/phosphodiesterase|nr:HD domain-containing protein [Clostridiales bacterium]